MLRFRSNQAPSPLTLCDRSNGQMMTDLDPKVAGSQNNIHYTHITEIDFRAGSHLAVVPCKGLFSMVTSFAPTGSEKREKTIMGCSAFKTFFYCMIP